MDVNAKIIPFPLSPARAAELLHGVREDAQDSAIGRTDMAAGRQDSVSLRHYKSHRERLSLLKWAKQGKRKRTIAGNA